MNMKQTFKMIKKPVASFIRTVLIAVLPLTVVATPAFAADRSRQVIVRFDTVSDVYYDPEFGSTAILSFVCETPYVMIESNPAAADAINARLSDYYAAYLPGEDGLSTNIDMESYMLSLAEDWYSQNPDSSPTGSYLFTFSHRAYVSRCDDEVISFLFNDYTKDMDAPVSTSETVSFDALTGQILENGEIGSTGADAAGQQGNVQLSAGNCRLLSSAGMAADPSLENISVIDLIETNPEGEDRFFCVPGTLYDVRIVKVVFYDGTEYEKEQLWYCNAMSGEAVQIKSRLDTGTPELKLIATAPDGSPVQMYIADN